MCDIITPPNLTLTKDIILIIGSLTGTFFTFYGLSKWKKEYKGKVRYETSRKLLKSTLQLRDAFQSLRSPMIWSSEFLPKHDFKDVKESEKKQYVFENRLKYLTKDYNEFQSVLPEVEIEYGETINKLCSELLHQIGMYKLKLGEYIQIIDRWDVKNPHHKELNNIVFNNSENNKTTIAFNETIELLKKELIKELK
jgi:hypothetical protein